MNEPATVHELASVLVDEAVRRANAGEIIRVSTVSTASLVQLTLATAKVNNCDVRRVEIYVGNGKVVVTR